MRNRKLGRTTAQRRAMLRGMVTLLLECGKIETTYTRAQEVSAKADEMITLGKKGDLAAYRAALEYITKEDVAKKLFSTVAPAYADVNGGYTTVLKMGPRRGDGAEMAIVKLVEVKAAEAATEEAK
jgi:large subunit ribosomal protein L17